MATWNSRGLRGSTLEELINRSNEQYREKGLALIQKVPTPITPVRIAKDTRQITLAYFEQKSTVDYIGAVQGIPVCFDAKECKETVFPLANIHEHQVRFMREFEQQEGISFLLIYFSGRNEFYYLTFRDLWWFWAVSYTHLRAHETEADLWWFWERAQNGGRKSFLYEELNPSYFLTNHGGILVPYLDGIQKDLQDRD